MAIVLKDQDGREAVANEGESHNVTFTLMDGSQGILLTALASLTASLFDSSTGVVIGDWLDKSILNTNGGTVDANCNATLKLEPGDNIIISTSLAAGGKEKHRLRIKFVWNDGDVDRTGKGELEFSVEKEKVLVATSTTTTTTAP